MLPNKAAPGSNIKTIALVTLVVQSTTLVLMLRWSKLYGKPYLSSTVVFGAEVLKLLFCVMWVSREYFSTPRAVMEMDGWTRAQDVANYVWQQAFGNKWELLKITVPGVIYTIQNNLLFFALANLDAATYQVVYQLKILTTALFSVFLLRASLNRTKWVSLVLLFIGVCLVQLQIDSGSGSSKPAQAVVEDAEERVQYPMLGLAAVLMASVTSGFAGVYFEKVLKESRASLWVRNIQLGLFGAISGAFVLWMQDGEKIASHPDGFWQGWTPFTWVILFNQAFGGLVIAVVVKYADNIIKGFANAISIVLSCILSIFLFNFLVTSQFAIGAALVVFSVYLYTAGVDGLSALVRKAVPTVAAKV